MHTVFKLKNLNIRDHLADVDEDDTLMLQSAKKKETGCSYVNWIKGT
jgi:hypothetical protein